MENYIFSPKQQNINATTTESMYFTLYGNHDFIDDNGNPRANQNNTKHILAKQINSDNKNQTYYYIKVGAHGRIFNPIGMYSEGKQQKFLSKIGKNEFEFEKVNQKTFELYLNFLRTKNIAWLNNAEREMI